MKVVLLLSLVVLAWSNVADAHVAAWARGMYCQGGPNPGQDDPNNNYPTWPVYQLPRSQWWFQADRGCDRAPPAQGVFLNLPAGGSFTVELAHNRGQTTMSYDGAYASQWMDGMEHPEDWRGAGNPPGCISDGGNIHTNNHSMTGGTAFAISYNSNLNAVTLENLVVFSVLPNTPWKRVATYQVPADLPPCPADGCTCAWLWIAKGCGEPNMYMQGFKCMVTGSNSNRRLAQAQVPRYCANFPQNCVRGAKQMMVYEQAEGNNVQRPGDDFVSYSDAWGYFPGAQNDIFE